MSEALVWRLLARQLPAFAALPLRPVLSAGTDHAIWRLGDDMAVRLPRHDSAAAQTRKVNRWLPRLAPHLPLATPLPLALGEPDDGFPYPWSVCRWLEGEDALGAPTLDLTATARDLARFIQALQAIDPADGPAPGIHNFHRGVPLVDRDAETREAIAALGDSCDPAALTRAWEDALQAPPWQHAPLWLHGDLHQGNLLLRQGRLTAVIDFGGLGVGDPATDLIPAWTLLDAPSRRLLRQDLQVDDATWARGRGWALSMGLIALPYYRTTNPVFADVARRAIDEALADLADTGGGER